MLMTLSERHDLRQVQNTLFLSHFDSLLDQKRYQPYSTRHLLTPPHPTMSMQTIGKADRPGRHQGKCMSKTQIVHPENIHPTDPLWVEKKNEAAALASNCPSYYEKHDIPSDPHPRGKKVFVGARLGGGEGEPGSAAATTPALNAHECHINLFEPYGSAPPPPARPMPVHNYSDEFLTSLLHPKAQEDRQHDITKLEETPSLFDKNLIGRRVVKMYNPETYQMRRKYVIPGAGPVVPPKQNNNNSNNGSSGPSFVGAASSSQHQVHQGSLSPRGNSDGQHQQQKKVLVRGDDGEVREVLPWDDPQSFNYKRDSKGLLGALEERSGDHPDLPLHTGKKTDPNQKHTILASEPYFPIAGFPGVAVGQMEKYDKIALQRQQELHGPGKGPMLSAIGSLQATSPLGPIGGRRAQLKTGESSTTGGGGSSDSDYGGSHGPHGGSHGNGFYTEYIKKPLGLPGISERIDPKIPDYTTGYDPLGFKQDYHSPGNPFGGPRRMKAIDVGMDQVPEIIGQVPAEYSRSYKPPPPPTGTKHFQEYMAPGPGVVPGFQGLGRLTKEDQRVHGRRLLAPDGVHPSQTRCVSSLW